MRSTIHALLTALLLSTAVGCATKVDTQTSAPALGSDAHIVAKKGKTGNIDVSIEVTNLAPPGRLVEGATAFVVWLIPADQPAVRVGALDYDEKDRAGALDMTSPDAAFTLVITLEEGAGASTPGKTRILEAAVSVR
ncbi:MAG: hypothetical protein R3A79_26370 [Nannocystaceae bacterium]